MARYIFVQEEPVDMWVIEHNLGKQPSVAAFDESHTTLIGIVTYVDENKLIIKFSQPISGTAVLN